MKLLRSASAQLAASLCLVFVTIYVTARRSSRGQGASAPLHNFVYCLQTNQLEKLEAARSAYLWLPLVTYPYLWFYLSLP